MNLLNAFSRNIAQDENPYRTIADQIGDALFLIEPKSGVLRYCNDKSLTLLEYKREETSQLLLSQIFSTGDSSETIEMIRNAEPGIYRGLKSVLIRKKNGSLAQVDLRISAIHIEGESLSIVFARDITEQSLPSYQVNTRYRNALQSLGELMDVLPNPSTESYEAMLRLSRQFLNASSVILYRRSLNPPGLKIAKAINFPKNFLDTIDASDPLYKSPATSWHSGERLNSSLAFATRAAKYTAVYSVPIMDRSTLLGAFVAVYESLADQPADTATLSALIARYYAIYFIQSRRAETAADTEHYATEVSQQLEALMEHTGDGVLRINSLGRVVDLNPAAENLLGFKLVETTNDPLEDVLVSSQPLVAPMMEALRRGETWGSVEADLVRRDGESITANVRAAPFIVDEVFVGGFVVIADRRQQKFFQTQSIHLENRAWLGDLAAIFAHEVRNPLNGISMGLTYLASKFNSQEENFKSINKMQDEVIRIEQLLKSVLLVSKSSKAQYQRMSLIPLIERTLMRWSQRLSRSNIQVQKSLNAETPHVMADANQMDQVFTNLIGNALDAMSKNGGTLSIQYSIATRPPTPGKFVELIFTDTGSGISEEIRDRVFDPFITTKADGTGLGLAITKQIINGHKGTINVESWQNIGTAFHVFLPISEKGNN